jgi:urocanate hydratase
MQSIIPTRTECNIIIQPHRKTAHHWKGAVQRYAKHGEDNCFSVDGNNADIYIYMATIVLGVDVVCSTHQCHATVQEGVQHHGAFFSDYERRMTEEAQESVE